MDAEHHHPGDPEEDDVVGGLHDRPGVVVREVGGLVGPPERGERPEPRAEPRVEDVRVLDEVRSRPAARLAGGRAALVGRDRDVAARAVPRGDPVAPPELAAHVPVADLGEPVLPHLLEPLGEDHRLAAAGRREGGLGEGLRPHEPLRLQARLDDVVAPLAAPDDHLVRPRGDEVAARLEVGEDPLARLVPVEARVGPSVRRDAPVVLQDVDDRQVVALPGGGVVVIVGRRDLHGARPERGVHHVVGDDRDVALDERDPDGPADQRPMSGVVRVDRDAGIAEDRLRARGGDLDPLLLHGAGGRVDEVVPDRPQRAGLRSRDNLEVREARTTAGAPVDERLRAVREPLPVEPEEGGTHGAARLLVHREAQPAPVERRAHAALLGEDHALRLLDEVAHALQVPLPPQACASLALGGDDPVEHELRGDRGVVQAREEERRPALHPRVADHQVLDGGSLRVTQVERTGDVRRRLDDDERRRARVRARAGAIRREDVGREPAVVDGGFDVGGAVRRRQSLLLAHLRPSRPARRARRRSWTRPRRDPRPTW